MLYLPQRPSLLPGSPTAFLETIKSFRSRSAAPSSSGSPSSTSSAWSAWLPSFLQRKPAVALPDADADDEVLDPYELSQEWDVDRLLWERSWGDLSGGEGQRIALATAFARGRGFGPGAEVILLDGACALASPAPPSL